MHVSNEVYVEDLIIDKSLTIASGMNDSSSETNLFLLYGGIHIILDEVEEFSIIGAAVTGKISSELADVSRTENSIVNIIDCFLFDNVDLNHITCFSNIIYTVLYKSFYNSNLAYSLYYNPSIVNCSDFENGNYLDGSITWSDFFAHENEDDLCGEISFSEWKNSIPTISINTGNVVGSRMYQLIVGHKNQVWKNSSIVNDSVVQIVNNTIANFIFDNPSYGFNLRNNILGFSGSSGGVSPSGFGTVINRLNKVNTSEIPFTYSSYYGSYFNENPYSSDSNGQLNPGTLEQRKYHCAINIHSANSSKDSYIANNNIYDRIGIDNEGYDQTRLSIVNNYLYMYDICFSTNNYYGCSSTLFGSPQYNEKVSYAPDNHLFINNYNLDSSENYPGFEYIVSPHLSIKNWNPDYQGYFAYNKVEDFYVSGVDEIGNDNSLGHNLHMLEVQQSFVYENNLSSASGSMSGVSPSNEGHPSYEYYNLNLTRNTIGIDGGSYSNYGSWNDNNGNGDARIIWLNLPHILNSTQNFNIKAIGVHRN